MNALSRCSAAVALSLVLAAPPLAAEEKEKGESKEAAALKSRSKAPAADALDAKVSVEALLSKGAASDWSNAKGARVEGYVMQVEREDDGDVHLALAAAGDQTDTKKWVLVEVPPAWQKRKPELSEKRLRALVKKHVRVTGWLYYDADESDDPRGTRWEIHPVTDVAVVE
jgi:hypothetical protein